MSIATAQMYLMRFFACKTYHQNNNFIVAVAALFVASKTENKPRPLHQIAHACWKHWSAPDIVGVDAKHVVSAAYREENL